MAHNVNDSLELPWVTGQHVGVVSNADTCDTGGSDPEAKLRAIGGFQAWVYVAFEMSSSPFVTLFFSQLSSQHARLLDMGYSVHATIQFHVER